MKKKLKILMLEDLEDDAGLIDRALRRGGIEYSSKRVDTKEEFIDAIENYHPDVILSDHSLPQFNSTEALKICKKVGLAVPFILVTGTVSEEFAVTCLKLGADDYILKSNLTRLPAAIQNALKQHELLTQRKKAENDLRQQNEELVKINREMDSFVYSVSHNLRAPLMSVLGLVGLAQQEDSERGGYFSEYFNMMSQSITKLDDTLKEILDYSKNARHQVEYQRIDIKYFVDTSLERLKYLEGFNKIETNVTVTENFPFYSDSYRVAVILNNIMSNAIKYRDMSKEKSVLNITGHIEKDTAVLVVEDNGIGIHKNFINKIFGMFFRATEKSEGAGLGLYIVKETMDKLHGKVAVESEFGKGTKFTLEFPNHAGTILEPSEYSDNETAARQ